MSDIKVKKGDPITADAINNIIDRLPGISSGNPTKRSQLCAVFKTPGGGIPARSGTTLGEAECQRVGFDGRAIIESTGDGEFVRNLGAEAVAGSVYIQALWIEATWLANWEQCE